MRQLLRHYGWILLVAVPVFFVNLGAPKLWDRDEPRNAGCAVEMLERHDWVVPVFNDELRVHKPVLLYWFMMSAYAVFGVGEFAARFWSAVFGLGTVLMTYHMGRRLFSPSVGLWSAISLASCLMFPVAARAATPDSVLVFFTTAATAVYVFGAFPKRKERGRATDAQEKTYFPASWPLVVLIYALMGLAVLAKGPVGFLLPMAVIGMFLLIVRLPAGDPSVEPHRDPVIQFVRRLFRPFAPRHFFSVLWSMRPLTATVVILAVALPWYLWVGLRTDGEWLRGFFLVHHFQRATESMEGHTGPFFYYLIAIIPSFFPWSLLLLPTFEQAANRIRRRLTSYAPYVLITCWAALYIAAFSCAQTKLPNYITPAMPALALLTGCFLDRVRRQWHSLAEYWFRFTFDGLVIVGVCVGTAGVIAGWAVLGDGWVGLVGIVPVVGGLIGRRYMSQARHRDAIATLAVAAGVFAFALFALAAPQVSRHRHCDTLFAAMYARASEPQIATYGCFESSWVFYARRPIQEFHGDDLKKAAGFIHQGGDRFLLTTSKAWPELEPLVGGDVEILARVPYFMRRRDLLLLVPSTR